MYKYKNMKSTWQFANEFQNKIKHSSFSPSISTGCLALYPRLNMDRNHGFGVPSTKASMYYAMAL